MPKRLTLVLDDDNAAFLAQQAGSVRRQSALLNRILTAHRAQAATSPDADTASLRLRMLGLSKELADVASQLAQRPS